MELSGNWEVYNILLIAFKNNNKIIFITDKVLFLVIYNLKKKKKNSSILSKPLMYKNNTFHKFY
jgi:hypothetical protein